MKVLCFQQSQENKEKSVNAGQSSKTTLCVPEVQTFVKEFQYTVTHKGF